MCVFGVGCCGFLPSNIKKKKHFTHKKKEKYGSFDVERAGICLQLLFSLDYSVCIKKVSENGT